MPRPSQAGLPRKPFQLESNFENGALLRSPPTTTAARLEGSLKPLKGSSAMSIAGLPVRVATFFASAAYTVYVRCTLSAQGVQSAHQSPHSTLASVRFLLS